MTLTFRALGTRTPAPVPRSREFALKTRRYCAKNGFEAFIEEGLVERAFAFARDAAPNEWVALLGVRRFTDDKGSYVVVEALVPFTGHTATHSTVETTVAGEHDARRLLAHMYPSAEPGGWLHTHPGWGHFFSDTDRRTQSTWRAPWSLGIVVDHTVRDELYVVHGPHSTPMCRVGNDLLKQLVHPASQRPPRPRRSIPLVGIPALMLCLAGAVAVQRSAARHERAVASMERRIATVERAVVRARRGRTENTLSKEKPRAALACVGAEQDACFPTDQE